MNQTPETLIAHHIATCTYDDLPQDAIAVAKRSIADGVAAMMAGCHAAGVGPMMRLIERWSGARESRIFGTGRRAPAPQAAWVNGAMMRALELDDCTDTLPLHPTAALLPALLATADAAALSGRDLLRGLAIAQDLKVRFGLALAQNAMQTGRNNMFRVFAIAAGVAAALGLDEGQTLNALGLSASSTAGDAQCLLEGSMASHIQFGNSAHGAIQSVLLAQEGVTGPKNFLTGRYGYLTSFEPDHDLGKLLDGLGERFEGTRISVKPYAACRCTHAAIDLARAVRSELGSANIGTIERVEITVAPEVHTLVGRPSESRLRPSTAAEAQFSLNFTTATALLHGRMGLADSEPGRLQDEGVLALAQRVHVSADERHRTDNVVGLTTMVVRTDDGRVLESHSHRPFGGPANPISSEQLRAKMDDCLKYSANPIAPDAIDAFLARIDRMESEPIAADIFDPFA
ncbi:MmgE/PrpD family protein [Sinomonas atrocyanea]